MKISIIIPVYNIEEYIEECIQSIIKQTLKEIEVICINDGSTDSCLKILEKYSKENSNIKIINQKNRGQGFSRNIALDHCNGEYVFFLDGDDYIKENALERMYIYAKNENLDILTFDAYLFYDKNYNGNYKDTLYRYEYLESKTKKGIEFIEEAGENKCFRTESWLNLYKRDFLINNEIRFSEQKIYEDIIQVFDSYIKSKRIKYVPECFLNRRIRNESAITKKWDKCNAEGYYRASKDLYKRLKVFENDFTGNQKKMILKYTRLYLMRSIRICDMLGLYDYRDEIKKFIYGNVDILEIRLDMQINSPSLFYQELEVSL